VQVGNLLFLSGCGRNARRQLCCRQSRIDLDVEQAYAAARVAGLAMLARIRLVEVRSIAWRASSGAGHGQCRADFSAKRAAGRAPRSAWRR